MTNAYSKINEQDITRLTEIVGADFVIQDEASLRDYAHDETEDIICLPEVIVKPNSTKEVSKIMAYAHNRRLPVTARGAGSGLAGGAIPALGGIVLSLERMNRIVNIDMDNLQVQTEPGVITEVLQNAVKEKGLFYPPDPASSGWCFIGGNVATNSGGPRALKYGVVKDYVLNLEVVLASGEVIETGAQTLKNSTGYNLTQLMVGSEGTLGVVTQITLKLIPLPKYNLLMLVPFSSAKMACAAVSAIFQAGITPSALEFMERSAIDWAIKYIGHVNFKIEDSVGAHLLIEVDGNYLETLYQDCEVITEVVEKFGADNVLFADNDDQKRELWKLRKNVGHAVKLNSIYKEEDTVVPRAQLPELLDGVKSIGEKYNFTSVCYGHAGDGNLHVNILKGDMSDEDWNNKLHEGIAELFHHVKHLGGTISGEHGIGLVQKRYMTIVLSPIELKLMTAIKNSFDPHHILNPQKIFPEV